MKFVVRGQQTNFITVEVEAETEREAKQLAWEGRYINKEISDGEEVFDEAEEVK